MAAGRLNPLSRRRLPILTRLTLRAIMAGSSPTMASAISRQEAFTNRACDEARANCRRAIVPRHLLRASIGSRRDAMIKMRRTEATISRLRRRLILSRHHSTIGRALAINQYRHHAGRRARSPRTLHHRHSTITRRPPRSRFAPAALRAVTCLISADGRGPTPIQAFARAITRPTPICATATLHLSSAPATATTLNRRRPPVLMTTTTTREPL